MSSSSSKRNFYEILNATPSATVEELKINYKNLILQCHPDKLLQQQQQQQCNDDVESKTKTKVNLEIDPQCQAAANDGEFVAITEAWNCLKDPIKRKRYDAELLLNKFHTHNNIYAHIQLHEMKKCPNTEIELVEQQHYDDDDDHDDDGGAVKGMESDCHELPPPPSSYIYTYDCRCGGQYIVDESAEQYCRKGNNTTATTTNNTSSTRSTGAVAPADGGGVKTDTKETTVEGGGSVNGGGGDEQNNHDNDDDDDGELIVECSECSLVIILNG
ncbi:DPH4 homolog [Musca vetustissima]|uniref:DPH4 homolog n=1 Tax=Musca vetustissima TaxID=27455 RepID=UPI002AB5EB8E|nr:DPH4 homolog [Musca vetustissima]